MASLFDPLPLRGLTLHASMTRLREDSGLLGVQSLDVSALQSGSTTVGRSLGFDWLLSNDLTLSGSATVASAAPGRIVITVGGPFTVQVTANALLVATNNGNGGASNVVSAVTTKGHGHFGAGKTGEEPCRQQ